MKRSGKRSKSPRKSLKKAPNKSKKRSLDKKSFHKKYIKKYLKKHKILKLAEPIRQDVEKIVKKSGYSLIKTALITAAVAALIAAGADKYNIKSITNMVVPYIGNNLPQVDVHGIINVTVQNFPEVNVNKFHDILSNVDSTEISSIASKNIKESIKYLRSIEKPTLMGLLTHKTIKLDSDDIVYVVIPSHFNKNRELIKKELIPINDYMKNEEKYIGYFDPSFNPEIVIKKTSYRYEGYIYEKNIPQNLYKGTSSAIKYNIPNNYSVDDF